MTDSFTPSAPLIEAVIRSPLGDIRVWLEPDAGAGAPSAVCTSIRIDYADDADRIRHDQAALRLVAELARAVRGLSGVGLAETGANQQPSVGPWMVERVEADPASRTLSRHLHLDYVAWCDRHGFQPLAVGDFTRELDGRGFRTAGTIRQGGLQGRARGGLRLRPFSIAPLAGAAS